MQLPREGVRAARGDFAVRDAADGDAPTLFGHFAVFNRWTQIEDWWDGPFMERVAPGAFAQTISEDRDQMRVLFQHGMDPQIGSKPIAALRDVREDDDGAYYEASLLDGVPPLLVSGLRAGTYGASFRFMVREENVVDSPKPSETNPKGLPERTIVNAQVSEFGPVTWGAYQDASAGLRMDEEELIGRLLADPERLRRFLERLGIKRSEPAPVTTPTQPEMPVRHLTSTEWTKLVERKFR